MGGLTIAFLVMIGFFAARGYFLGLFSILVRYFAYIAGAFVAHQYAEPLASGLLNKMAMPRFAAVLIVGVAAFFVMVMLINFAAFLIRRSWRALLGSEQKVSTGDRALGAVANTVVGFVLGLILVWGYGTIRDKMPFTLNAQDEKLLVFANQSTANIFQWSMTGTFTRNDLFARLSRFLVESPVQHGRQLREAVAQPELQELLRDPDIRESISMGQSQVLVQQPQFQRWLTAPEVAPVLAMLDLQGLENAPEVAKLLTKSFQAADKAKADPRFQQLLSDPTFSQKLNQGDYSQLVSMQQFRQLIQILYQHGDWSALGLAIEKQTETLTEPLDTLSIESNNGNG